jgi:hypothetical protein
MAGRPSSLSQQEQREFISMASGSPVGDVAVATGNSINRVKNLRRTKWFKNGLSERQRAVDRHGSHQLDMGRLLADYTKMSVGLHAVLTAGIGKFIVFYINMPVF